MGFSLFGLSGKDLAIGGITAAFSMIPGAGVVLGPLAGAATSAIWAHADGKDWDASIQQGLVDGALGALPVGRIFGRTLERLAAGQAGRLGRLGMQNGAQRLLGLGQRLGPAGPGGIGPRALRDSWGLIGTRAVGRGLGAAGMNAIYDSVSSKPSVDLAELPIKPIS
jgi:hypothetical protein